MSIRRPICLCVCFLAILASLAPTPAAADQRNDQWSLGLPSDPSYFTIGVWSQAPRSARVTAFAGAGINLYVGFSWDESDAALTRLRNADMRAILHQNAFSLARLDSDVIAGRLQQDEPDKAQSNPSGGYYSPVPPLDNTWWNTNPASVTSVFSRSTDMQALDDTRPVFMNLGQGVAWDGGVGRGIRTNHPEDYAEYV